MKLNTSTLLVDYEDRLFTQGHALIELNRCTHIYKPRQHRRKSINMSIILILFDEWLPLVAYVANIGVGGGGLGSCSPRRTEATSFGQFFKDFHNVFGQNQNCRVPFEKYDTRSK